MSAQAEADLILAQKIARAVYEDRNGPGCVPWIRVGNAHQAPYIRDGWAAVRVVRTTLTASPTP
jgi:hypothetical protein